MLDTIRLFRRKEELPKPEPKPNVLPEPIRTCAKCGYSEFPPVEVELSSYPSNILKTITSGPFTLLYDKHANLLEYRCPKCGAAQTEHPKDHKSYLPDFDGAAD